MGQAFLNSLYIACPSTVLPVFIASLAAFGFAWLRFPGRDWLFLAVVALLVVPIQMTFVPVLQPAQPAKPDAVLRRHLAGAHGLRAALRHLPAAQLLHAAAVAI